MSITVRFNNGIPDDPIEICEASNLEDWVMSRFNNGIPENLYIYKTVDTPTQQNDVSGIAEEYEQTEGDYYAALQAGDAATVVGVVALVVGVVSTVLALSAKPKVPANANRNQSSPTNALSQRANEPRVNQRVSDPYGFVAGHVPDQLMLPYTKFIDMVETEYSYMCIGRGWYDDLTLANTLKEGDTPLINVIGSGAAIYGPNQSPNSPVPSPLRVIGTPPTGRVYTVIRSNEVDGMTLQPPNVINPNEIDSYSINGAGVITVVPKPDASEGFDLSAVFTPGTRIQITSGMLLTYLGQKYYNRAPVTDPLDLVLVNCYANTVQNIAGYYTVLSSTATTITIDVSGLPAFGTNQTDPIYLPTQNTLTERFYDTPADYPDTYINGRRLNPISGGAFQINFVPSGSDSPLEVVVRIPANTNNLWLNFVGANGVYRDDGGELPIKLSIEIRVTLYELTSAGVRTGNTTWLNFYVNTNGRDYTGTTAEMYNSYTYAEVGARRTTNTDRSSDGTVVDDVKWRDMFKVEYVPNDHFGDVTTIHTIRRATVNQQTARESKLNLTAIRNNQWTFAEVVQAIAVDPYFGRLTTAQVDIDNLQAVQNEIISYFGTEEAVKIGYVFDTTEMTFEEALGLLCNAVNVVSYRIGEKIQFYFEKPQSESSLQFTHRSKWPESDTRTRRFAPVNDYDGIELTYRDQITTINEIITLPTNSIPLNPNRIELPACVTKLGATIRARREYNKQLYSRIDQEFESFGIARLALPSMRVDATDDTSSPINSGEVLDQDGLELLLSQPVEFVEGEQHSIVLTLRNGSIQGIPVSPVAGNNMRVLLANAPIEDLFVGYAEAKTCYNFGTDSDLSKMAMLIQTIDNTIEDSKDKTTINCTNYDDRYYSGDLEPI